MKRRVRFLRRAECDLVEIQAYLIRDSPRAADRVVSEILDAVESLEELAERAATPRDARLRAAGFRFLVRHRYLVLFKIRARTVVVYRVLHGRRAYTRLL